MSESSEKANPVHRDVSSREAEAAQPEREIAEPQKAIPSSAEESASAALSGSGPVDLTNAMLGEFRLLRRLGRGGMAEVYLAEQTSLKRHVAIKVMRPDFLAEEVYQKRFEREALAAAALNHPNIVQVYAVGEANGIRYIAQEYVHGINLRQFLNRKGPPSLSIALRIMKQVAMALHVAGKAGIVHRDIKPENILITRQGQVKVTDFGLAQLTHSEEPLHLTRSGSTVGTPLYMSPEQINGKDLDQRSDIYSLGVTFYHLLAGRPPFLGETAMSVAAQHLHQTPVPLSERRPDLPPRLCHVVHKMMAKKPEDRYPDALSVCKELAAIEKSVKTSGGETELTLGELEPTPSLSRSWSERLVEALGTNQWLPKPVLWACGVTFVVFALIGRVTAPRNPLRTPAASVSRIEKQESAAAQFYLAMTLGDDEDAWLAVERYFPEAQREVQLARSHRAVLYLRQHRLEEARTLFAELAALRNVDADLRAKGLAGLAIVASLEGKAQEAQRIIASELAPLRDRLDDQMRQLLDAAVARNTKKEGEGSQPR